MTGPLVVPNATAGNQALNQDTGDARYTSFPSGTKLIFQQSAAPTGWTKDTTHDNKALRVVSGTAGSGGLEPFTRALAKNTVTGTVNNHTLTVAQMPSHSHAASSRGPIGGGNFNGEYYFAGTNTTSANTGGGGAHSHGFTGTVDIDVQYVDVIIATKD
jgi:hypothetical protein